MALRASQPPILCLLSSVFCPLPPAGTAALVATVVGPPRRGGRHLGGSHSPKTFHRLTRRKRQPATRHPLAKLPADWKAQSLPREETSDPCRNLNQSPTPKPRPATRQPQGSQRRKEFPTPLQITLQSFVPRIQFPE